MNLKEQRYICTLAETGRLSLAAQQLYISQPALSLYISNLEESLGVKLFERVGKRFLLTHIGELYVQKARQMLDLKMSFDLELASYANGYKEHLSIGMQEIRSSNISPELIQNFYSQHPNVDLLWYEGNYKMLEDLLNNGQIEMFFCNCPIHKKEFKYTPVYYDNLKLVVHKDHPMLCEATIMSNGAKHIDLMLFKNDKFILQSEGQSLNAYSRILFEESHMHPKDLFTIRKIPTMLRLIDGGFGVGFCPESYLKYAPDVTNVELFSVGKSEISLEFAAVRHKDSQPSPIAERLIEMLVEIMQRQV